MNYDQHMSQLTEAITTDKSIAQPYRNSLLSDARRLHMQIRGAKTFTSVKTPVGLADPIVDVFCTCPEGGRRRNCPLHGEVA